MHQLFVLLRFLPFIRATYCLAYLALGWFQKVKLLRSVNHYRLGHLKVTDKQIDRI